MASGRFTRLTNEPLERLHFKLTDFFLQEKKQKEHKMKTISRSKVVSAMNEAFSYNEAKWNSEELQRVITANNYSE